MGEIFGAGVAFVFPLVMHYSALRGERLLAKIVTPVPKFDAVYNQRPLLISVASGMFLAAAALARTHPTTFYILVAVGLALLTLDMVACVISFARHVKSRRR